MRRRSGPEPLNRLRSAQASAARPTENVWLSASAGTGKTQVLSARVMRLLMQGVVPQSILCLTFTKAGAAEMANRIQSRLAHWVLLKSSELAEELIAIGEDHGPEAQAKARTLFAEVVDAPGGGLRIQTIHGFCQTILASFPLESGLIPGFRPLEEREQASLQRTVLADLISDAERDGRLGLIAKIQSLALRLGEDKATEYLYRCGAHHSVLDRLVGDVAPRLRRALQLPAGDISEWVAAQCADGDFDCEALRLAAAINRGWAAKTGVEQAERIEAWLAAAPLDRVALLDDLRGVFLTEKGALRASYSNEKQLGAALDVATTLAERIADLAALPGRVAFIDDLAGSLEAGREYAREYDARKRSLGVVDFDDLIARTVTALNGGRMSEWLLYKLDQSIDHLLVDESQDTNTDQWSIVAALSSEYFAGAGAKDDRIRTLFTVGDFKQAIYGFQGTSPHEYAAARRAFGAHAHAAGRGFEDLSLEDNFRSTPPVLAVVDAWLGRAGSEVLGIDNETVAHVSAKPGSPGQVVLWPTVARDSASAPDERDEIDDQDETWIDKPAWLNADSIAKQVRSWIDSGCEGQPVSAGDVMILVRSRGELARLLVARLHAHGVRVAGVDRLVLSAPLVVKDLLAAARFALQPLDDLNLANLLVSPIGGWSQDELLAYAHRDARRRLWPHLTANAVIAERIEPLRRVLAMADQTTPYRFFEEILSGPMDGRRKLLHRLGEEARDPIEELLNAALQYEQTNTPSLQPFLSWFDTGNVHLKREQAESPDEARVMTVHGAKGLQSRIVILADATADPDAGGLHRGFDWAPDDETGAIPVFPGKADLRFGSLERAAASHRQTEREEHWRLLYVALTRAEEMLFIGGALGRRAKDGAVPTDSWYAAIDATLDEMGVGWEDANGLWQRIRRYCPISYSPAKVSAIAPVSEAVSEASLVPEWARQVAPQEARPSRPLAPSSLGEDTAAETPFAANMAEAAERGRLLHGLFERLPEIALGDRAEAARRWLARQAPQLDDTRRSEMAASVCAIIASDEHTEVFGPNSLAEVPIAAVVGEGVVSGQIDRLVVHADYVAIVDFKTGRQVPASAAQVPTPYLRQMAAYAAAIEVIFPGKAVRAALLYSSGPTMIEIDAATLTAHRPDFAAAKG